MEFVLTIYHFCSWCFSSNYIESNKLVFKPVFPKQFHFLKPLNIFMTLLKKPKRYFCKKGNIEARKRGCRQRSISRYKTLLTTQVENLQHAISHFIQHHTFSALNYAQNCGNRMKESLKRTANSKSRIVPCQILSCLCYHSELCLSHQ